jgi:integrase
MLMASLRVLFDQGFSSQVLNRSVHPNAFCSSRTRKASFTQWALLIETGLRCVDVVRVGRHNIREGVLRIVQQKNGIPIANPVTAKLAEAINAAAPADHLVFLLSERGAAFTAKGFGKWFSAQCDRIGLHRLSPHGVRKLAATRMAEGGATAHELRERLARNAVARSRG